MPATGITIRTEGVAELIRALDGADRSTNARVQQALESAAAPIARDAEGLALGRITNIGPRWSKFRVGATRQKEGSVWVYIAPAAKNQGGPKRPNLAVLLLERAMLPAVRYHEADVQAKVDAQLSDLARDFNSGSGGLTKIPAFGGGVMRRGAGGRFTGIFGR